MSKLMLRNIMPMLLNAGSSIHLSGLLQNWQSALTKQQQGAAAARFCRQAAAQIKAALLIMNVRTLVPAIKACWLSGPQFTHTCRLIRRRAYTCMVYSSQLRRLLSPPMNSRSIVECPKTTMVFSGCSISHRLKWPTLSCTSQMELIRLCKPEQARL